MASSSLLVAIRRCSSRDLSGRGTRDSREPDFDFLRLLVCFFSSSLRVDISVRDNARNFSFFPRLAPPPCSYPPLRSPLPLVLLIIETVHYIESLNRGISGALDLSSRTPYSSLVSSYSFPPLVFPQTVEVFVVQAPEQCFPLALSNTFLFRPTIFGSDSRPRPLSPLSRQPRVESSLDKTSCAIVRATPAAIDGSRSLFSHAPSAMDGPPSHAATDFSCARNRTCGLGTEASPWSCRHLGRWEQRP